MKQKQINKRINEFLSKLKTKHTCISDYVNCDDIDDYSKAFDIIEEKLDNNNGLDVEIIYYNKAIKYLSDNDQSLLESLEIATELGFELDNLNSEVLAGLLASRNNREEFQELEGEITTFFDNLYELTKEKELFKTYNLKEIL